MIDLSDATSPGHATAAPSTLVVPLGSIEQHGPHLPLGTDGIIADGVARAVARRLSSAAVAPLIPIGASGEHAGFPGTLSIGTEALAGVLVELARDAARDYERLMLINAHGGNGPAIAAAERIWTFEQRSVEVRHCHFPGGDAHAGRTETSVMLHLAPELVRLDLIEPGNPAPVTELLPHMRRGGVAAVSPNGVLGDPTRATAEEGARLVAALVERILDSLA